MPFPAWLLGTPAEPPHQAGVPAPGPEHPPSLGDKARAGESPPRDAADTCTRSWERRFQLCGRTPSSRSGCGQRMRDTWWEGCLNTGAGCSVTYPNAPQEPNPEVSMSSRTCFPWCTRESYPLTRRGLASGAVAAGEGMEAPAGSIVPHLNYLNSN